MANDRRLRILLVDDEPDILLLLQAMLTAPTWEIVGKASGGADALRIATAVNPDVAVVDYMMPGMHGMELAQRLKDVHPNCFVVLFSAYDVKDEADVSPYVDRFLAKTDVRALTNLLDDAAKARGLTG
ncbi:MAG TPA: response regulator [Acidimicrobiales bacterium]|nr:response regulator [Acidimicrobiales bacterium]